MGDGLQHRLAQLAVAVGELRQASLLDKARQGERCLALQMELLGVMVHRIGELDREVDSLGELVIQKLDALRSEVLAKLPTKGQQ